MSSHPLRARDYFTLNAYWFALSFLWNAMAPLLLPTLVPRLVSESYKGTALGIWGKVTATWWTHKIKGLHRNDFIMATKTDKVASGG